MTQSTITTAPETYNGWANYETWNVSLWIGNDEYLYKCARKCYSYKHFVDYMMFNDGTTPDGVKWNDSKLDIAALNEMLTEF